MKSLRYIIPVLVVLALLAVLGNRLVGAAIDARLAPILARELGLPVALAPVRTHLPRLRATSPGLVLGDDADPAVRATDIEVVLSPRDLLRGEIRFLRVAAATLAVDPKQWPAGEGPPPADYRFLAPWLPRRLEIGSLSLAIGGGAPVTASNLLWQRDDDGGASLDLRYPSGQREIELAARVETLPALLALRPVRVQLHSSVDGAADSRITAAASVQPAPAGGYLLEAEIGAAGMQAGVSASAAKAWRLPSRSETALDRLDIERLQALWQTYLGAGEARSDPAAFLDAPVPELDLPAHEGRVRVEQIRFGQEEARQANWRFALDGGSATVTDLRVQGPAAQLGGSIVVDQAEDGWRVSLDARLDGYGEATGIAQEYVGARWLLREGSAQLVGSGSTWGRLLYSLSGAVELSGHYRGTRDIPIEFRGMLDTIPGELGLDSVSLRFGQGTVTGSAHLTGEKRRRLALDITAENLDLTPLASQQSAQDAHGIPVPDHLALLPGLDVSAKARVSKLLAPGLTIGEATATLERTGHEGRLEVNGTGITGGQLSLELQTGLRDGDEATLDLRASFERLDLPSLFRQQGLPFSRSSGTVSFSGQGADYLEIFGGLRGRAELALELRPDDDWQRPPQPGETLRFSGAAGFVLRDDSITGLRLDDIDIDSREQDISGQLSMVAGRDPWLDADFNAPKLNLTQFFSLLPERAEEAADRDVLATLRNMGAARIRLSVGELVIGAQPLHNMTLELDSAQDRLDIRKLDFTAVGSRLESRGNVRWQRDTAVLDASARLEEVNLDQFLIHSPEAPVPVSGEVALSSRGETLDQLLANLTGRVDLAGTAGGKQTRRVLLQASREPDGMSLQVEALRWGETELAGALRYREDTPPSYDVTIDRGTLSLRPWEKAPALEAGRAQGAASTIGKAAKASAGFVGDLLRAPLRLLGPDEEGAPPDERVFSPEPLPLAALRDRDIRLRGRLEAFDSTALQARDITFDGELAGGRLGLQLRSAAMNGGSGEAQLDLDAGSDTPELSLSSSFRDVRGLTDRDTFPRSGFLSIDSRGASPAELAGAASGLLYVRFGEGPFDYLDSSLFTADIATTIFRTLLPGIENQAPRMQCGTGLLQVKDGLAATPFGFAARTHDANIVGRLQIDLKQEELQLSFDSSSREGVGISVGSVFSNTIQVRGPLSNPRVEPRATSLLFRGWAAFMTAGLSIVGESVIKRALASENPCHSVQELIEEQLCPVNPVAASSDLVCPDSSGAAG